MNTVPTAHGPLPLPAFLPDATRAVVRSIEARDAQACGVDALMVNALHLAVSPGTSRIASLGGLHRFMGWAGPIASDSGGFQLFSMAGSRPGGPGPALVGVDDDGATLKRPGRKRTERLTPETSIRQQWRLGADILFCLDECPAPGGRAQLQQSVRRTVAWAARCKEAFTALCERRESAQRPLLFAVVQGGDDPELRRECARALVDIGFDGYGFGGWPVDDRGRLLDLVGLVAGVLPAEALKHGLGIGKPDTLVDAWRTGYQLFDCVIPTRDARHGRLFRFTEDPARVTLAGRGFYREIAVTGERYAREKGPVEPGCPCPLCTGYSAAYLHHLFAVRDGAGARLATLHNLTFYARLMRRLREDDGQRSAPGT